jgi:hypothetical protein
MNYKEFYHWLEGYLDGKLENKQIDIAPIVEKMSHVREDKKTNLLTEIPIPKSPVFHVSTSTIDVQTTNKSSL